ncbi:MAG: acetyltransferase [Polyangiaceae bacterium]|nr:acetyltransferase [Polyangiaceae bacterium]
MTKTHKLVIVGNSAFAEIAYEYFTHDSPYEVVAFSVDREFIRESAIFGLPVVPFDELSARYEPRDHSVYAAMTYTQLNRLRTRFAARCKAMGYRLASYVSSRAFVWRNVTLGEHCFVFEDNTLQPFVKVGNNVVLWSGNHIGHHSLIGDNTFIASHVVVSGFCEIGESCFLGVNATLANNVTIGRDCLIGAGATILRDTAPDRLYGASSTSPREKSATAHFGVPSEA